MRPHLYKGGDAERRCLQTIIEEARLRGYFPFEELIQAVAVAGRAARALAGRWPSAGKHVLQPLDEESRGDLASARISSSACFSSSSSGRRARHLVNESGHGRFDRRM